MLRIRVLDAIHSSPVGAAVVDIRHRDASGDGELRGAQVTDTEGYAEFRTVHPGREPGRPVQIAASVHVGGYLAGGRTVTYTGPLVVPERIAGQVIAHTAGQAADHPGGKVTDHPGGQVGGHPGGQVAGHPGGLVGGHNAGQVIGQAVSHHAGQNAGQAAGQTPRHTHGRTAGQAPGHTAGQAPGHTAGQIVGLAAEQAVGQAVNGLAPADEQHPCTGGTLNVVPRDRFDLTAGLLATITVTIGD